MQSYTESLESLKQTKYNQMEHLYGDTTGLIHLISSILALIFGTIVLMLTKGTKGINKWDIYIPSVCQY